jgi:OmpA-OmpF porin, OOP family
MPDGCHHCISFNTLKRERFMLDSIISMAADKFGLGDKAKSMISMLVGMMFDKQQGGFSGFMQKFKDAGMGDIFSSWVGGGADAKEIQPDQIAKVFGGDAISGMASKLGLPNSAVTNAAAGLLPGIVGKLTPGGQIPSAIPGALSGLLNLGDLGGGARSAVGAIGAAGLGATAAARPETGSGLGFLKWLIPLLLLLGAGYWFMNRKPAEMAPATPSAEATPASDPAPIETPVSLGNAKLSLLTGTDGKTTYSGTVNSEPTKTQVVDALKSAFGATNISGDLTVDANTADAGWLAGMAAFLPKLKAKGANIDFDGNNITLGGAVADADKAGVSDALRAAFTGFNFSGLSESLPDASVALSALSDGGFTAQELMDALNIMGIQFDTGKATIKKDSQAILEKAAAAIKKAPEGTKLEVGGHTDNVGQPESNMKLSDARANAVRARLIELGVSADMLIAKGYGDTKPSADNATDEGRAKNRRMQFSAAK